MPFTTGHDITTFLISFFYTSHKTIITSEQRIIDIYASHCSKSGDGLNKQNLKE